MGDFINGSVLVETQLKATYEHNDRFQTFKGTGSRDFEIFMDNDSGSKQKARSPCQQQK
jgi:hypothetical protein